MVSKKHFQFIYPAYLHAYPLNKCVPITSLRSDTKQGYSCSVMIENSVEDCACLVDAIQMRLRIRTCKRTVSWGVKLRLSLLCHSSSLKVDTLFKSRTHLLWRCFDVIHSRFSCLGCLLAPRCCHDWKTLKIKCIILSKARYVRSRWTSYAADWVFHPFGIKQLTTNTPSTYFKYLCSESSSMWKQCQRWIKGILRCCFNSVCCSM